MIEVGFTLQPDERFLALLCGEIDPLVDYYEVAPETMWRRRGDGELVENGFYRRFLGLAHKPFVAHGVGLSLGSAGSSDQARRERWLRRVEKDHADFRFRWYTDHLGVSAPDGLAVTLPLPLWMTEEAASVVQERLLAMQSVVPAVGVENSVSYFLLGDPMEEAEFLSGLLRRPGMHLLLDLHNLYTMSQNFGFAPADYLARLDLGKVIEIHISGGAESDPSWLGSGRVLRLDSHDAGVPEPVWRLLEEVAPRCPALRGITLERMEGTVAEADIGPLCRELLRLRTLAHQLSDRGAARP